MKIQKSTDGKIICGPSEDAHALQKPVKSSLWAATGNPKNLGKLTLLRFVDQLPVVVGPSRPYFFFALGLDIFLDIKCYFFKEKK